MIVSMIRTCLRAFVLTAWTFVLPLAQAQQPTLQRFFAKLATDPKGSGLGKTATVGSPTGYEYRDWRKEGGLLVGFDLWKGNFQDHMLVVCGVRPIYMTAKGKVRGKLYGSGSGTSTPITIEGRDGFAVAGIEVKGGDRMDQLRVVFMKYSYTEFNLLADGMYKSEWFGGKGGRKERRFIPGQKPVVGIFGGSGSELDRLGLLYMESK